MIVHRRLLTTNPDYVRARAASENRYYELKQRRAVGAAQQRTGVTRIPVVVHVVFNTAAQNISDAQIKSQIDVLNLDFRMKNADVGSVPAPFKPVVADARVEFALATTDPGGAATTGVTRTQTNRSSFPDDDSIKSTTTGGANAWPADKYLNVWIAPRITSTQGDLLGYAQFPGGPAATDGVVILHSAFGTIGTAAPPFNLGRTTTHEIGHYLNLRHIWGDDGSGCSGSDFVNDTPNQAGPNFGTPVFPHISCNNGPNGDMFMNYMDYVDDVAMFMFTMGQVDRMQTCLDADRPTIGTTVASPPVPTTPSQDITTLKFRDDQPPIPSLKFRDDFPPSLKFRDDQPPIPSLKFRDDFPPSLKFRDDQPLPTLKFLDDGGATLKFSDDVKAPQLDKSPGVDQPKPPVSDQGGGPFFGGGFGGRSPFVLSTPHHSMAWTQSFPQAAQETLAAYEQQIRQYEELLESYVHADATGQLRPEEQQQADALYQEYQAMVQEYRRMIGG